MGLVKKPRTLTSKDFLYDPLLAMGKNSGGSGNWQTWGGGGCLFLQECIHTRYSWAFICSRGVRGSMTSDPPRACEF